MSAIRGGRPVAEPDAEIAADLARRLVRQRWIVYTLMPLLVLAAFRFALGERGVADVVAIAGFTVAACTSPWVLRDARRARRWLAHHAPRA